METAATHDVTSHSYGTMLVICCGVSFVCYFGSYMRIPVVPLYARSIGADSLQVGLINSAFMLMAGVLSLPLGMISDRLGRKLLASLGLLVLSGTSFLLYFSYTPMQLAGIYVLFGIGLAAFGPTMMSVVADFTPPTHLGRAYGWYTTSLYGAMSIGPAAGGFVAEELGYQQVFLISGVFMILTFWLVLVFLPRRHGDRRQAAVKKKTSAVAGELLRNRPLLACWLATLGGCLGLGMFLTFLPLHAQNQGLSLKQIGLVFGVQGLSNAMSRIPFGHLSDKVAKRSKLVVIGLVGFAASMGGFGISGSTLHFAAFAVTLGVSMGLAFTSVGALIAEVVPPDQRGLAMGGYNTCIYLGMMLSSAVMGGCIGSIGFRNAFLLTALINVLMIFFFHLLMKGYPPGPVRVLRKEKGSHLHS
jgi:MFS transporter, DHA1 family, multidrug resistance protein